MIVASTSRRLNGSARRTEPVRNGKHEPAFIRPRMSGHHLIDNPKRLRSWRSPFGSNLRKFLVQALGATAKRLPVSSALLELTLEVICNTLSSGPCGNLCAARNRAEPSSVQGRSTALLIRSGSAVAPGCSKLSSDSKALTPGPSPLGRGGEDAPPSYRADCQPQA